MGEHLQLLAKLKVKKIYWVDDENAQEHELNLEKMIQTLAQKILDVPSADEVKQAVKPLKELATTQSRSACKAIEDAWSKREELDAEENIISTLSTFLADDKIDPKVLVQAMLHKLPKPFSESEKRALASAFEETGEWDWLPISFSRWAKEHETILADESRGDGTALLVVDLQNDRESSPINGEDVLRQWAKWVVDNNASHSVFVIAFTSKYKKTDELKAGRQFADELFRSEAKPSLPVLVLSKDRLNEHSASDDSDVRNVAQAAISSALGRLRACLLHWNLAGDVQKLFADSVENAFKALQELSIEELLMAISGANTVKEGASDVDTLIRLAGVAQRSALLASIAKNRTLTETLLELRGLSEIVHEFKGKELAATNGIRGIQASEVYYSAVVINALLSPLSTGDIFELELAGNRSHYILVSNACDLTIRGDTGRRKLNSGVFLRLQEKSPQQKDQPWRDMPNFPTDSPLHGKSWVAEYHAVQSFPLTLFDLCWLNEEGVSVLDFGQDGPVLLTRSQRLRLASIRDELADKNRRIEFSREFQLASSKYEFDARGSILKAKFAIRRVGRMADEYAGHVVEGFARNISRTSLEHDMSEG